MTEQHQFQCPQYDKDLYAMESHVERSELWEPDLRFVRGYAKDRACKELRGLPFLAPLRHTIVEGTVSYAAHAWSECADVWLKKWNESGSAPTWDDLDGAAKNQAIAVACYEHFKRDMDFMDDLFVERMMPGEPHEGEAVGGN